MRDAKFFVFKIYENQIQFVIAVETVVLSTQNFKSMGTEFNLLQL